MPAPVITKAGDMIDEIAYRTYGWRPGAIEAILEANPGLCEHPPLLPAGLVIEMPELPALSAAAPSIRLWD